MAEQSSESSSARIWKLLGGLCGLLILGIPLGLWLYQPTLKKHRQNRERELLISELQKAGITYQSRQPDSSEDITGLTLNGTEELQKALEILSQDYARDQRGRLMNLRLSGLQISTEQIEILQSFHLEYLQSLQLIDCELPENSLDWLHSLDSLRTLQICRCRMAPLNPAPSVKLLELMNFWIADTELSDQNFIELHANLKIQTLRVCGNSPSRSAVEKLLIRNPDCFRELDSIVAHEITLSPWIPALNASSQRSGLQVYDCEIPAETIRELNETPVSFLSLMTPVKPDLLSGLQDNTRLSDLTISRSKIDDTWQPALSGLPPNLDELTFYRCTINSPSALQGIPNSVKKIWLTGGKIKEADWDQVEQTQPGRFIRPPDKNLTDHLAACCP